MRISFITPTAYVKDYGSQGDFILALAHLIDLKKESRYEKEIKAAELPIILDNSLFENHKPEPLETLIKKAVRVGASHFFAPDILYSSEDTQKELEKAVSLLQKLEQDSKYRFEKTLKIAAVVQADNIADYLDQLRDFNENPNVDLIGLSILSIPKSFDLDITESRILLMQLMLEMQKDGVVWKNCHLLGLGSSLDDVIYAKENCPFVVSHDSSSAFWNAMFKKKILDDGSIEGGKTKNKVNFNYKAANQTQLKLAQQNINQYKKLTK